MAEIINQTAAGVVAMPMSHFFLMGIALLFGGTALIQKGD